MTAPTIPSPAIATSNGWGDFTGAIQTPAKCGGTDGVVGLNWYHRSSPPASSLAA